MSVTAELETLRAQLDALRVKVRGLENLNCQLRKRIEDLRRKLAGKTKGGRDDHDEERQRG